MLSVLTDLPLFFIIAVQIACIVHVFKQNRSYYWIFFILFFPFIGSLVYFIVEILPGLKHSRFVHSYQLSSKASKSKIRSLQEQVAFSGTVQNKLALADAHLSRDEFSQAYQLYQECLSGIYAEDPHISHKLADAAFGTGQYEQAITLLVQLKESQYKDYKNEREFLLGLAYAKTDKIDQAIHTLEECIKGYPGEEARYTLGTLYQQNGQSQAAAEAFNTVIQNKKRYKNASIGKQNKWVSLSKKALKELNKNQETTS